MEERVALYAKEIRSVQPKGPYYIGGWCAAGPLAVETARQIIESGEEVAMGWCCLTPGVPDTLRNWRSSRSICRR